MKGLQRFIIGTYRFLGLLSIPALTVVTTISMANLFTAGKAAQWDNISVVWAWIYAAAIETNVVRLFTEKRKASFALGLGLGIVTCIALQFEGMQQTGSMMWNNPTVQMLLPWIIALRSILVYVLIAYEGRRLMQDDKQVVSAQPGRLTVLKNALLDRAIERVTPINQPAQVEPSEQPKQFEQVVGKVERAATTIYALFDPRTEKPFYVGKTIRSLPERLNSHLSDPTNKENERIFDELAREGLRPIIDELEVVSRYGNADERETYWIRALLNEKHQITNAVPLSVVRSEYQVFPENMSALEKVRKALSEHPNAGYNELGRLTDLAPATAKKYRELSTTQDERVATGGS